MACMEARVQDLVLSPVAGFESPLVSYVANFICTVDSASFRILLPTVGVNIRK